MGEALLEYTVAGTQGIPFEVAESYPQKRLIKSQETANFVVFLCRDESLGITGGNIPISAGSMWWRSKHKLVLLTKKKAPRRARGEGAEARRGRRKAPGQDGEW